MFLSSSLPAQDNFGDVFTFDTMLVIDEQSIISNIQKEHLANIYKNTAMFTNIGSKNIKSLDTITFFSFNTNNRSITKVYCISNNLKNEKFEWPIISSFAFTDSLILISCYKDVLIFRKISDEFYTYSERIKLNHSIHHFFNCINDTLLIYATYYMRGNKVSFFNLKTKKNEYTLKPPMNLPQFSVCGPNNFFDANSKYMAFSDASKYTIEIKDYADNTIQTIQKDYPNWKKVPASTKNALQKTKDPHKVISILNQDKEKYSVIDFVYFISETELLVSYRLNLNEDMDSCYIDIWKLNMNSAKFELEKSGIFTPSNYFVAKKDEKITKQAYPFSFTYIRNGAILFINDFMLISSYNAPINPINYKYSEYNKACDDYFYENNPVLLLQIYDKRGEE